MHLSMELFKQMTGTQLLHVPYKAIQQANTDAIGGQLQVLCDNMGSILPHVKAGRLRGLGVTSSKRSAAIPELPTVAEAGIPGFEIMPWSGYVVPARVSRDIVVRLNAEINRALASPTIVEKFAAMGSTPIGGTPEQFAEHVRKETAKWGKVIKTAGIRPD
jgi:tripartite-type tricarboxylate transporter receptor subunit TctC